MYSNFISKLKDKSFSSYINVRKDIKQLFDDEDFFLSIPEEESEKITDLYDHINMVLAEEYVKLQK